jgi:hypothetical protein
MDMNRSTSPQKKKGAPKAHQGPSTVLRSARLQSGAGKHGGSKRQQNRRARKAWRQEVFA